jgi:hypothetical protein
VNISVFDDSGSCVPLEHNMRGKGLLLPKIVTVLAKYVTFIVLEMGD